MNTIRERIAVFKKQLIYPVTCEEFSLGRKDEEILMEVAQSKCKIIQLRDKNYSTENFLSKAIFFRKITKKNKMLLIINDNVEIAKKVEADGVHLGQTDKKINLAREILGKNYIIGISCHNKFHAIEAEKNGANYINIGPIYATNTKKNVIPLGEDKIMAISNCLQKIPFTVMGGIKQKHFPQLINSGARQLAMVTEITTKENIAHHINLLIADVQNLVQKKK